MQLANSGPDELFTNHNTHEAPSDGKGVESVNQIFKKIDSETHHDLTIGAMDTLHQAPMALQGSLHAATKN